MEKEICEIPSVVEGILKKYNTVLSLKYHKMIKTISSAKTIHIAACGTSYHAGLILGELFEKYCQIRTKTYFASEVSDCLVCKEDVCIVISQSGETTHTLNALEYFNKLGIQTISLVNVENSTMANRADFCINLHAGPEISVASTKVFVASLLVGVILINSIAKLKFKQTVFKSRDFEELIASSKRAVKDKKNSKKLVHKDLQRLFYLGTGLDVYLAYEAALKIKETCYIHCEGYASGEFKHGPIAMVDDKTMIVDIASDGALGFVIGVIPNYFFALYLSRAKGLDPDKPRNLTKCVKDLDSYMG